MTEPRFFLGYGERLTSRIAPPGGGGGTDPAYTFQEAVSRLRPLVRSAADTLSALPSPACPENEAVGVITLHPQWMSKSAHPQRLLDEYELRQVGSRPVTVQPEKWTRLAEPEPTASSELYVAGNRSSFLRWAADLGEQPGIVDRQIQQLEAVRAPLIQDRLRNVPVAVSDDPEPLLLEVVLHASESERDNFIIEGFAAYAEALNAFPDLDRRFHAGGLCFLPVEADTQVVPDLARFAFLRVARPMPRLREIPAIERSVPAAGLAPAPLPTEDAVDPDLRIAVFDGGMAVDSPLSRWATPHDPSGIGPAHEGNRDHGHAVTSAVLFGPLVAGQQAPRPYGVVDHYRVLDKDTNDVYDLYDVLPRIDQVLKSRRHELVNLSIGPYLPIEDDEVHPWTALLDEHLSDGNTLLAIAVGNDGNSPSPSEARIQVPADCVNGISVGSADTQRADWRRASYSSRGPGRSPGVIKPDVMTFGGDAAQEQFLVYDPTSTPGLAQINGTSFASPSALRLAAGVRAHFGTRVGPLGLKALLVHSAQPNGQEKNESGWGRLPSDVSAIAVCEDGMARIIYQGELTPSQYLRASVPLPTVPLVGKIEIAATFCYATPTDPEDPGSYTRSGLGVTFRPHLQKFKTNATVPTPQSFFGKNALGTEQALRSDANKWETTLNASHNFYPSSLSNPVFDVHYNAREGGGLAHDAGRIRYALVVTVRAKRMPQLYDQILQTYSGVLEALTPVVDIPVRV
jgi:hypothetical protein